MRLRYMIESDRSTPAINIGKVLSSLKSNHTLGYESLKPQQIAVIKAFVSGRDVFAVLSTGYGKSVCFAILSLVFDCSWVTWLLATMLPRTGTSPFL